MKETRNIIQKARRWMRDQGNESEDFHDFYCETRDIFQARLERMTADMIREGISEEKAYLFLAIVGEIGNNSFDHNAGSWPKEPGVFFGYQEEGTNLSVILADKGVGILKTLSRVKPDLRGDADALQTAFTEKISGRAPENRGNGLKFVRQVVSDSGISLEFTSGDAKVFLNGGMDIQKAHEKVQGCFVFITIGKLL